MEPHELEALADRLAIEDLLTRYAHAVDRHDWDLYRSVFTDDAHIDYPSAGGIASVPEDVSKYTGLWSDVPLLCRAACHIT